MTSGVPALAAAGLLVDDLADAARSLFELSDDQGPIGFVGL